MLDVLLSFGADLNLRSDWDNGPYTVLDHADDASARYLIARGATLTAGEVANRHPGFRPIVDALRRPQGPQARGRAAAPVHVEVPADLLNGKPSLALVFPVPETDWKLVQVSPKGELE